MGEIARNVELEEKVLGCLFLSDELIGKLRGSLKLEFFSNRHYAQVYRTLLGVYDRVGVCDIVQLRIALVDEGWDPIEAARILGQIQNSTISSKPASGYVKELTRLHQLREIQLEASTILQAKTEGELRASHARLTQMLRQSSNGKGPRALALGEALTKPPDPVPWAVKGLLTESDLAILSGTGGVGKTWLLYSLALSFSLGLPLWDHWPVTRSYRVTLLDLESAQWIVVSRLRRLWSGFSTPDIPLAFPANFWILNTRLRFDRSQDVSTLFDHVRETGTELLLVDSLRRTFRGSENDAEVVSGLFTEVLDPLRQELGCSVILTDHTRKLTGEMSLDTPEEMLRGSGDKRNLVDCHFGVLSREDGSLMVCPTKTRGLALPEPFLLNLEGLEAEPDSDEPIWISWGGSLDKTSGTIQDAILAYLTVEGETRPGELIAKTGYSKRGVQGALAQLRQEGKVVWRKAEGRKTFYRIRQPHEKTPSRTRKEKP